MLLSNILLLEISFPLEFLILHSTNRDTDENDGAERRSNEMTADQSDTKTQAAVSCPAAQPGRG